MSAAISGLTTTTPTSATSTSSSTAAAAANSASQVSEQEFMQLLMAQMQHQDPTQPMDNTQMVSQLAQFSALEQQTNTNSILQSMQTEQNGSMNMTNSTLIGKSVTVNDANVSIATQGIGTAVSFGLPQAASAVTVTITDSSGNTVKTMNLGAMAAGSQSVNWNGLSNANVAQPAGTYQVSVTATANGAAITPTQQTTSTVSSVSFAGGTTVLNLANGATASPSNLMSINGSATSSQTTTTSQ